MSTVDTNMLGVELLDAAQGAASGRAARSLRSGKDAALHHTVLAMTAGAALAEHDNPGVATVLVLRGRIVVIAGDERWDMVAGDYLEIPPRRHRVEAVADSVFFLTTVRD